MVFLVRFGKHGAYSRLNSPFAQGCLADCSLPEASPPALDVDVSLVFAGEASLLCLRVRRLLKLLGFLTLCKVCIAHCASVRFSSVNMVPIRGLIASRLRGIMRIVCAKRHLHQPWMLPCLLVRRLLKLHGFLTA